MAPDKATFLSNYSLYIDSNYLYMQNSLNGENENVPYR